jgi:hypothetical protein
MATQTTLQEPMTPLDSFVHRWDRRLRLQQTVLWLARSLLPGVVFGIVLVTISWLRPFLLKETMLTLTIGAVVGGVIAMLAFVWLWPRSPVRAAQRFDLSFGLKERVSTALELRDGRIHSNEELTDLQMQDAWNIASGVAYAEALPLKWPLREWGILGIVTLIFIVMLLLPNPQTQAIEQQTATNAAIEEATDELKELTEMVASDTSLSDEDREQLLETLESSIETLQEENISPEEAFATLSDVQTELQERANELNEQLRAQQEALREAAEALSEFAQGEDGQQVNDQNAVATLQQATEGLGEQMESMTQAEREQAAEALEQAADSLEASDPQTAQAMRDAAQALREGDLEAAREALERMAESMEQSQQQQTQQQATQQQMQQAADQTEQNAEQIGQEGQQGQGQGQEGDQGMPGANSQPLGGEEGQTGDTGIESAGAQDGGETNQTMEGSESQVNADVDSSANSSNPGAGAGDSPANGQNSESFDRGSDPIDTQNNPDGGGVGEFEPIYSPPNRIDSEDGNQVNLDPGQGDVPITEGQFQDNPAGESIVPYNQVFSDYADAVNRALDNDYIPLGLRDVVRDYFSSLDPSGNANQP